MSDLLENPKVLPKTGFLMSRLIYKMKTCLTSPALSIGKLILEIKVGMMMMMMMFLNVYIYVHVYFPFSKCVYFIYSFKSKNTKKANTKTKVQISCAVLQCRLISSFL